MSKYRTIYGTFKSILLLWKQLFIVMKFGGVWVPVCFAWLSDKNALTYKIGISKNKKVFVQKRIEKKVSKKKCPVCAKGFNKKSLSAECKVCDSLTH